MDRENLRILIIDSDIAWVNFSKKILESYKISVMYALSLQNAENLLQKNKSESMSIVFIEASIFNTDYSIINKIRNIPSCKNSFIKVLFPMEIDPEISIEVYNYDSSSCEVKPYDADALVVLIEQTNLDYRIKDIDPKTEEKSFLIIDDDINWLSVWKNYLPPARSIETISDYISAVEKMALSSFDVIIIDLRLKDSDNENLQGFDLIKRIRQSDEKNLNKTSIIMVSAFATPRNIRDAYEQYNVECFIDKRYLSPPKYQKLIASSILAKP